MFNTKTWNQGQHPSVFGMNIYYLLLLLFTYLFCKHKYKFTNTSLQIKVIILNKNMFAGGL